MHLTNVYNFGLPIYCFSDVWCVVLLCFVAHSIQRFTERSRLLTVAGLLHSLTSDSDTRVPVEHGASGEDLEYDVVEAL